MRFVFLRAHTTSIVHTQQHTQGHTQSLETVPRERDNLFLLLDSLNKPQLSFLPTSYLSFRYYRYLTDTAASCIKEALATVSALTSFPSEKYMDLLTQLHNADPLTHLGILLIQVTIIGMYFILKD